MASIAKYKEENRKLQEKLNNTTLGDEDTQLILDQIDENNRIIEEESRKEKIVFKVSAPKVPKGKRNKKKGSIFKDGSVSLL